MRQFPRVLLFWALIAAAGLGASFVTRAQTAGPAPSSDILPSLLTEVRGLRAAMEQMASAGPRVQLALGRLQLQEARIQNLVRRLEMVRANQESPQRECDKLGERLKAWTSSPPEQSEARRQVELELPMIRAERTRICGELQKLLNEETFLNQEISNEQARWTDFNQRLEELERSLVRR